VLTEKVLPMQAHLITVADLPGLIGKLITA
jgi:hypothetical protein